MLKKIIRGSLFLFILGLLFFIGCKTSGDSAQFTLTVSVGEGITGIPTTGTFNYAEGDVVNYNYTVQAGYENLEVKVLLEGTGIDTTPPVVNVLRPNGGERLVAGCTQEIEWSASDEGGVSSVTLYYSADGGSNWTNIAAGLDNTGSYPWTVPDAPSFPSRSS